MIKPIPKTILFLFYFFALLIGYAQSDSLPRKKYFLKANGLLTIPFGSNPTYTLGINSVTVLKFTKKLNVHEFGLNSVKLQSTKRNLNNYEFLYFNIDLTYQYNYVFLKKRKIKPYLGINNDFLVYYEHTSLNSSYERRVSTFGIQDIVRLMIGALYLHKNRILFDVSASPLIGYLFDTGYTSQYYGDPALPENLRTVGGLYLNSNPLRINQFSDVFIKSIYMKIGIGIKI